MAERKTGGKTAAGQRQKESGRLPAGMRLKENGLYELRFTFEGKRYSVTGKTKKECSEKQLQKIDQIREQEEERLEREKKGYTYNADITFGEFFKEWQTIREGTVKESTIINADSIYDAYFRDTLGAERVRDIEKRHIIAIQKDLAGRLKATTVNEIIVKLKTVFNAAIDSEIIDKNPCRAVKPLKTDDCVKASETTHRALTEWEMTAFLNQMKQENSMYYGFFLFSLSTGMRLMEVNALTWADIHKEENIIDVNKTLSVRNGEGYAVTSPKTRTSKRKIPLTAPARQALAYQKELMFMLFGGSALEPDARIFRTMHGVPFSCSVVTTYIESVLRKLDKKGVHIEPFSHHACRDTFATHYLREGGDMNTLKTILGHSSLAMTADLYAHVLPDTKQQEMDKISGVFLRVANG